MAPFPPLCQPWKTGNAINKLHFYREALRKAWVEEYRQRELEVILTLCFQFSQHLGAQVFHCLPDWTVSLKERQSWCSQISFKTIAKSIRMTARRGYREKHLSKSHFLSNFSSQRQMRRVMEMGQGGQRGKPSRDELMKETKRVT